MFKLSAKIFFRIVKSAFNTIRGTISGKERLFVRKLYFLYIFFREWRLKFRIFGAKSRQVAKSCPRRTPGKRMFLWTRKREKNWRMSGFYAGFLADRFVGIVKFAFLRVQRSNFRSYFLRESSFVWMLPFFEGENFPPLMISFSSFFQNSFYAAREHFEVKRFFGNFLHLFQKYWELTDKFSFFCRRLKAGGSNFNLNVQRSIPRKNLFEKQVHKRQLGQKIQTIGQKFRQGCQSSTQRYHKNNQWEEKKFYEKFFFLYWFLGSEVEFSCFGSKSRRIVKACTDEQSEENVFVDKKAGTTRHWATFSRSFVKKCHRGCQICNINVHRSFFRCCFFLAESTIF